MIFLSFIVFNNGFAIHIMCRIIRTWN